MPAKRKKKVFVPVPGPMGMMGEQGIPGDPGPEGCSVLVKVCFAITVTIQLMLFIREICQ